MTGASDSDGPYRLTRAERDAAMESGYRLMAELQQRQRETRSEIGPPPHIAHEWAALTEREQRDVLRWAMRVARADSRRSLRESLVEGSRPAED